MDKITRDEAEKKHNLLTLLKPTIQLHVGYLKSLTSKIRPAINNTLL